MSRTDKRLRKLDDLEPSTTWERVRDRTPDPTLDPNATLQLGENELSSRGRRVGLIAAALAIGLAATGGLALAFRDRPTGPSEGSASSVLRVTCDGNNVTVETPIVAAQADGVHIVGSVTGVPDADIVVRSSGDPHSAYLSGSSGVDGEFVRDVPPGDAKVGCTSGPMNTSEMDAALTASFTIVDPDGVFVPYVPSCSDTTGIRPPEPVFATNPVYPSTPEEAVRAAVDGIQPTDHLEPAGYVQAESSRSLLRITRNDDVIGSFFIGRWRDGFQIEGGSVCADSGLAQRNSVTTTTG